MSIEAMKQALEALTSYDGDEIDRKQNCADILRAAIAKAEQESAREWVGLTEAEMQSCWDDLISTPDYSRDGIYQAIESKLREKNAGQPVKYMQQEPDYTHPKIQSLIGAKARCEIRMRLVDQLIENPECDLTALDMEYWDTTHDKLKATLTSPQPVASEPSSWERTMISTEQLHKTYRLRRSETTTLDPWAWYAWGADDAAALLSNDARTAGQAEPLLVCDLAEILGKRVADVCEALSAMEFEPKRSTNMRVTPDEAVAVAKYFTAQPAPQAVPQGWKLVPVEPTPEMLKAGWEQGSGGGWDMEGPEPIYRAMLSAAPKPQGE